MRTTKVRKRYLKKLYCTVKREVDKLDVFHLLSDGAPPDEFDPETKDICKRIMDFDPGSKEEVVKLIQDVFEYWMNIRLKDEMLNDIAGEIYGLSKTTWEDVEDCLFFGNRESILKCRCPECGSKLSFRFGIDTFELRCKVCCCVFGYHKLRDTPNCVNFFGKSVEDLG